MFSHVSVEFKSFQMFIEVLVLHLISSFPFLCFSLCSVYLKIFCVFFNWSPILVDFIVVSELIHEIIFFLSKLEKNYNLVWWYDHCIFIYVSLKYISPEPWKLMLVSNYQTIEYKFVKAWKMEWICIITNLVFLFSDSTHPSTNGNLSPRGGSV